MSYIDPASSPTVQPDGQSSGWSLTFSEEFDGSSVTTLDAAEGHIKFRQDGPTWRGWFPSWPLWTTVSGADERSNDNYDDYYTLDKIDNSQGSFLRLRSDREETYAGLNYTSGTIQNLPSGWGQQYGWWEAKLRLSTTNTAGYWPAWWMLPTAYNTWPPEIDVAEWYNGPASPVLHHTWITESNHSSTSTSVSNVDQWHTYGLHWVSGETRFYVDGVNTQTIYSAPSQPMFALIGSQTLKYTASFTGSEWVDVDWFRAWEAV